MDSGTTATTPNAERRLALFQYLFRHSRSQIAPQQFYPAFVGVLLEAFRADAICVWMAQSGKLQLTTAAKLDVTGPLIGRKPAHKKIKKLVEFLAIWIFILLYKMGFYKLNTNTMLTMTFLN